MNFCLTFHALVDISVLYTHLNIIESGKLFSTQDRKWVPQKTQISYSYKTQIFAISMSLSYVFDIMIWPKYWNNRSYESRIFEEPTV